MPPYTEDEHRKLAPSIAPSVHRCEAHPSKGTDRASVLALRGSAQQPRFQKTTTMATPCLEMLQRGVHLAALANSRHLPYVLLPRFPQQVLQSARGPSTGPASATNDAQAGAGGLAASRDERAVGLPAAQAQNQLARRPLGGPDPGTAGPGRAPELVTANVGSVCLGFGPSRCVLVVCGRESGFHVVVASLRSGGPSHKRATGDEEGVNEEQEQEQGRFEACLISIPPAEIKGIIHMRNGLAGTI